MAHDPDILVTRRQPLEEYLPLSRHLEPPPAVDLGGSI
jgi:hypothetical protein